MSSKVLAKTNNKADFELVDKLLAHEKGWQHYAFSIFIFNSKNELLLQKRAAHKYHSPNLWTNTCCSHPLSADLNEIKSFAKNRLQEEMGFTTNLDFLFQFKYKVKCDNNLTENEIDFVFVGKFDENPTINNNEASEYKWISINELILNISKNGQHYTEWLKIIFKNHTEHFDTENIKMALSSVSNTYHTALGLPSNQSDDISL